MKTITLILVCIILLGDLFSQEWAPVGSKWYYRENFFDAFPIIEDYIKFESVKDTIYQGFNCKKIIVRHQLLCNDRPEIEYIYSRNDTVFFYDPNFNEWQILYDFNSEQSQSWTFKIRDQIDDNIDSIRIIVDSTSIKRINLLDLKVLYVTYEYFDNGMVGFPYNSTVLEYIGDTYFLFNYSPKQAWACDANVPTGLRCYEDPILGLYETGIAPNCDHIKYWTSIENETSKSESKFQVYVDQAGPTLHITTEVLENINFKILDLSGRVLIRGIIIDNKINVSHLDTGVFIIELYDNEWSTLHEQKFIMY